jgi:RNA polymerase sigma factor (TIGR02999 family)
MDAVYGGCGGWRASLLRERHDHSLQATGLVHEAYLKLVDQKRVRWQNRAHFFAVAAYVMRRLLVDHARARGAEKRGAAVTVSLDAADIDIDAGAASQPDVLALDRALEKLAAIDPRHARLVELRYFGGMTIDEAAAVLDVAAITVKRDWALARTWLYRELRGSA